METREQVRRRYAERIRDVVWKRHRVRLSDDLVSAFARIPREAFLGQPPWLIRGMQAGTPWQRLTSRLVRHRHHADDWTTRDPDQLYRDVAVAIDPMRGLNSGQPSGLAIWIHLLELQHGDRVLHVGCGLGYYTAIIAAAIAPGEVIALEIDAELASRAHSNLASLDHVAVVCGDGAEYDPGLVDAILISAGVTHPRRLWLDRLRIGGRMILPLTNEEGTGIILKVRHEPGGFAARFVSKMTIFHCVGSRDVELTRRLQSALAAEGWRSVQSLRRDPHVPDVDCWFHGDDFCLSRRVV